MYLNICYIYIYIYIYIYMLYITMDWFPYDNALLHERVKLKEFHLKYNSERF